MSILCMLVEGIIEKKHRNYALKQGLFVSPVSVASTIWVIGFDRSI